MPMASNIDETKPVTGAPTTSSVRANFAAAKAEIEALQAAVAGATKVSKFSVGGALTFGLTQGKLKWYPEENITITGVFFSLGTAGSAAANLSLNGSGQMLASNVVTGASDIKSNTGVPGSPNVTTADYITVDVYNFGATASDITVHIVYQKT